MPGLASGAFQLVATPTFSLSRVTIDANTGATWAAAAAGVAVEDTDARASSSQNTWNAEEFDLASGFSRAVVSTAAGRPEFELARAVEDEDDAALVAVADADIETGARAVRAEMVDSAFRTGLKTTASE